MVIFLLYFLTIFTISIKKKKKKKSIEKIKLTNFLPNFSILFWSANLKPGKPVVHV